MLVPLHDTSKTTTREKRSCPHVEKKKQCCTVPDSGIYIPNPTGSCFRGQKAGKKGHEILKCRVQYTTHNPTEMLEDPTF